MNQTVLCELIWILTRPLRYDRTQMGRVLDRILDSDWLRVDGEDSVRFALYLSRVSRADFADCLIAASNGMLGCERTATFDRLAGELDEFELI